MSTKALSGKFPIGRTALDKILEDKGEDYAGYCKTSEADQKERERLADQMMMAMLHTEAMQNKEMKKKLAEDYSTRKLKYPKTLEDAHAIYLVTYNKQEHGSK